MHLRFEVSHWDKHGETFLSTPHIEVSKHGKSTAIIIDESPFRSPLVTSKRRHQDLGKTFFSKESLAPMALKDIVLGDGAEENHGNKKTLIHSQNRIYWELVYEHKQQPPQNVK